MVIDTNVIIYLLIDDNKTLHEASTKMFAKERELVITDVVLMECVYVLVGAYKKTREQVTQALIMILKREAVSYDSMLAEHYLSLYSSTRLDFADCYLIALALQKNKPLKTFDKMMQKAYASEKAKTTA